MPGLPKEKDGSDSPSRNEDPFPTKEVSSSSTTAGHAEGSVEDRRNDPSVTDEMDTDEGAWGARGRETSVSGKNDGSGVTPSVEADTVAAEPEGPSEKEADAVVTEMDCDVPVVDKHSSDKPSTNRRRDHVEVTSVKTDAIVVETERNSDKELDEPIATKEFDYDGAGGNASCSEVASIKKTDDADPVKADNVAAKPEGPSEKGEADAVVTGEMEYEDPGVDVRGVVTSVETDDAISVTETEGRSGDNKELDPFVTEELDDDGAGGNASSEVASAKTEDSDHFFNEDPKVASAVKEEDVVTNSQTEHTIWKRKSVETIETSTDWAAGGEEEISPLTERKEPNTQAEKLKSKPRRNKKRRARKSAEVASSTSRVTADQTSSPGRLRRE
ncbi:uncharacterized protein LOC122266202 [Penaeus japonicus]|uniref:uncharacterized protein LOC122266202 n=1 Tax=Penaeus japonicus TaxID=27405 RepID=UPI001C70E992|nr:uncharacterized protein LOC122266202 [Penaeus japonicus]BDW09907.1 MAG: hypothetical protein [Marsupenaeus japonicus pemonivirus]